MPQFRFLDDEDWKCPENETEITRDNYNDDRVYLNHNREAMKAFYNYAEPFSCECRAFGRLQEAGHEELAIKCFGYVLLDEAHEQTIMTQFSDLRIEFTGNCEYSGDEYLRSRFLSKDGRVPPIRGIVKELGLKDADETLQAPLARKILRDIKKLQQLGIMRVDIATRQVMDGKIIDFSMAVTTPHFLTNPELNPHLTPEMVSAVELEAFKSCLHDYVDFHIMISDWNLENKGKKRKVSVFPFPKEDSEDRGWVIEHGLRSKTASTRLYTFVDPRKYDWKACPASAEASEKEKTKRRRSGRILKRGIHENREAGSSKVRRRLSSKPSMWYYDCDGPLAQHMVSSPFYPPLRWEYKDGLMFPLIDDEHTYPAYGNSISN